MDNITLFQSLDNTIDGYGYEVYLDEPLVLNPGDAVQFQKGGIDTGETNTGDSEFEIILSESVRPQIIFSHYDVDYQHTDKVDISGGAALTYDPDFDIYAAYNQSILMTLNEVSVHINGYITPNQTDPGEEYRAGSFLVSRATDPELALRAECVYIDSDGHRQNVNLYGSNAVFSRATLPYTWIANGPDLTLTADSPITFRKGTFRVIGFTGYWPGVNQGNEYKLGGSTVPGSPPDQYTNLYGVKVKQTQFKVTDISATATGGSTDTQLDLNILSFDELPASKYTPQSMAKILNLNFASSQGMKDIGAGNQIFAPVNPLLKLTTDPELGDMIFRKVDFSAGTVDGNIDFSTGNTYKYDSPYYVGASTAAIEYGSSFQLNDAHMPVLSNDTPKARNIAYYWTGTVAGSDLTYHLVKQSSGIVIHDLQPASFWRDKLGLYEEVITPLHRDASGVQFYYRDSMKVTSGFSGVGDFLLPTTYHAAGEDPRKFSPEPPNVGIGNPHRVLIDTTNQSQALYGRSLYQSNASSGYYFIEVIGLPTVNTTRNGTDTRTAIMACVSKLNKANGIVIAQQGDGFNMVYRGTNSAIVSKLAVRVLDETYQPVTDLGYKGSVILSIIRGAGLETPPTK